MIRVLRASQDDGEITRLRSLLRLPERHITVQAPQKCMISGRRLRPNKSIETQLILFAAQGG